LGLVKMALKDFDGASIDFTEALAIKPTALRYRLRGWAHVFREAPRPARQDFEKAVELDPANGDAYAGRGYTQVKLGDYRKAVRDAEEALRRVPAENEKAVEARRLRYNAARIYAQAAGRVAREPAQQNARGFNKSLDYQEQALRLIAGVLAS